MANLKNTTVTGTLDVTGYTTSLTPAHTDSSNKAATTEFISGYTTGGRGVFGGGSTSSNYNNIDYITISTPGNAIDFGDLTVIRNNTQATSNGTNNRGIFGNGYSGSYASNNVIDYVNINIPSNAINFGILTVSRNNAGTISNS